MTFMIYVGMSMLNLSTRVDSPSTIGTSTSILMYLCILIQYLGAHRWTAQQFHTVPKNDDSRGMSTEFKVLGPQWRLHSLVS